MVMQRPNGDSTIAMRTRSEVSILFQEMGMLTRRRFCQMAGIVLPVGVMLTRCSADTAAQEPQMSWLDNGLIRLGSDLSIGGSITVLADAAQKVNMINSADWGRQVQMSFYSGPNPYIPEGATVNESWKGLGWNPIQSGDCYSFRSKIVEHTNDGTTLYIKCIPMQWPLKNVPGECTFECWYRLSGRAVQVRSRLTNNRLDKTQYDGRHQELPAVYTNAPYHKLMTYTGDAPYSGGPLTEIPKQQHPPGGIRWADWRATENWAALVDDSGVGVGVWNPGVYKMIGGFFGTPGTGGAKDSPTGYIAPVHSEILDWNIQYTYEYVLIADTVANIRQYVYDHAEKTAGVSYVFEADRQHWVYRNGQDTGWPIQGHLEIVLKEDKPFEMIGPEMLLKAQAGHQFIIHAAVKKHDNTEICPGRLYWKTANEDHFTAGRSVQVELPADGQFHTTTTSLKKADGYDGLITGLRFDPFVVSKTGDQIRLKSLVIR